MTIAGHHFTGTTAVSFGVVPAASFTVHSDTQLSAVSPPEPGGTVDVIVSNPAQSAAVAADRFTFGCLVPRLSRRKLKRVRKALRGADCRLGKVKGRRSGKVKKQRPKPGTVLPPDSKVGVKLG